MKTVIDFFEKQVFCHPESVAVVCGDDQMTYQDLSREADCYCNMLKNDYDIRPGDYVALCVRKKSLQVVSAILGVFKAGAIFLPINPDHPEPIINDILTATEARVVLTDDLCTDDFSGELKIKRMHNRRGSFMGPKNIAYSMYTSGTTGKPKGVLITHENLVSAYLSWLDVFDLSEKDSHLQMANISFDVFIGDWVRALCSGGTLVLCQTEELLHPDRLFQHISRYKITVAEFVPTTLSRLVAYLDKNRLKLDGLRLLLCGSDLWSVSDAKKAVVLCGENTTIYNTYGLTEATIDSTYYHVTKTSLSQLSDSGIVPIGVPFPHVSVSVRNEELAQVAEGVVGELIVGGKGVSKYGYIGEEELTKQRFCRDDSWDNGEMLYRTGDIAKIKSDGCVVLLGRNEHQVNINGKRIELQNVEYAIAQHVAVRAAMVVPEKNRAGGNQLVAYMVMSKKEITKSEIQNHLENIIPQYMIPAIFFEIEKLPLTANGKINRLAKDVPIIREVEDIDTDVCDSLEEAIMGVWSDFLGVKAVPLSCSFHQAGGTSLSYIEMLEFLSKKYQVSLNACMDLVTIPDIAKKIRFYKSDLDTEILKCSSLY